LSRIKFFSLVAKFYLTWLMTCRKWRYRKYRAWKYAFYKTDEFTRKSLPSSALIDWTVTNEPRLIARSNIRQQKPGKAHIADPW